MHHAPTVSYPVGRSHFQAGLLLFFGFTALLAAFFWSATAPWSWRHGLVGVALALSAVLAWQDWQRSPQGTLAWDGVHWYFAGVPQSVVGALAVPFDFQFIMLLSLTPLKGPTLWFWAERSQQPSLWLALRRAVFSRLAQL
jgi:hypothetical protein